MRAILLAACALGACTFSPADEDAAANQAVSNQTIAAPTPAPAAPLPAPSASVVPTPAPTIPVQLAPAIDETAEGAASVVRSYYALIGERKYAQAWALWENVGEASGMSAQQFAASFDKYARYAAQVGTPGAVDAGAGQRFVTVPVQVSGTLKAGNKPFAMQGSMILHRAVVDGATLEQKSWRIRTTDIKPHLAEPAPGASPLPPLDNRSRLTYKCIDGSRMTARFDPDNGRVTLVRGGKAIVLKQERMASGIRYAAGGISFSGKGENMVYSQPNLPPLPCTPLRR